jgi:hypothetical protein
VGSTLTAPYAGFTAVDAACKIVPIVKVTNTFGDLVGSDDYLYRELVLSADTMTSSSTAPLKSNIKFKPSLA